MTQFDPKPVDQPTRSHFRDAIQKGLGRTLLWAKQGVWTEKSVLLEACLTDLRYDRQCEDTRGPWLWEILEAVGWVADFREQILQSLDHLHDGLAAEQLCEFALLYARAGDDRFRLRLREIVAKKPAHECPWLGESELIALEGATGFLFTAQVRGETLRAREWDWDDDALMDLAAEKLGEAVVRSLLDRKAASSAAVDRFRSGWLKSLSRKSNGKQPRQSHADRMRQYTLHDIIAGVEGQKTIGGLLRGWGMYAQPRDLRALLDRLLECQEPDKLANYLRVFSNRALPEFDVRMMSLLDHADAAVRRRAYTAVGQNSHAAIRQFAIHQLGQRINEEGFLQMLVKNFKPGDEQFLFASLSLPGHPDDGHGILMDVIDVLEQNPSANCENLGLLAYSATPCGQCRHRAVKVLLARAQAPHWLLEESRYDVVPDVRKLVE